MNLLITGVGGFIGSRVARRLVAEGHTVFGVDDFSNGRPENVPKGLELIEKSLTRKETFEALPRKCDVILHLAGQSSGEISFDDPVEDLEKNTVATLNIIHYGLDVQARRLVYASSMSVYGETKDQPINETSSCTPLSCYGVGKLASERYLRIYGENLPFVIFRVFNVYGPGQDLSNLRQGMVSIFLAQALEAGEITVKGSLDRFRDFIYIDDVVETWFKATISDRADGRILNLGTGRRTTVKTLLEGLRQHLPGITWKTQGSTLGDQFGIYADTGKLGEIMATGPFLDLNEGLDKFIRWAQDAS